MLKQNVPITKSLKLTVHGYLLKTNIDLLPEWLEKQILIYRSKCWLTDRRKGVCDPELLIDHTPNYLSRHDLNQNLKTLNCLPI